MAHEPPKFSPPQADYERPQPAVPKAAPVVVRTFVMHGDGDPVVVRGVLFKAGDSVAFDTPAVELSYDYEGVEFVGRTFEADGEMYEVTGQDVRVLNLEVA